MATVDKILKANDTKEKIRVVADISSNESLARYPELIEQKIESVFNGIYRLPDTVNFNGISLVYDGYSHTIAVDGLTDDMPVEVTYSKNVSFIDPGKHEVIATFSLKQQGIEDGYDMVFPTEMRATIDIVEPIESVLVYCYVNDELAPIHMVNREIIKASKKMRFTWDGDIEGFISKDGGEKIKIEKNQVFTEEGRYVLTVGSGINVTVRIVIIERDKVEYELIDNTDGSKTLKLNNPSVLTTAQIYVELADGTSGEKTIAEFVGVGSINDFPTEGFIFDKAGYYYMDIQTKDDRVELEFEL